MKARVLVTGPTLHEKAVAFFDEQEIRVDYVPPYTPPEELRAIVEELDPHALLVRMGQVDAGVINAGRSLSVISKHGVGVDNIDVDAASARSIPVVIATNANSRSVAEHAMGLTIDAVKRIAHLDRRLREGAWDKPDYVGRELRGLKLGLVGFGAIAREFAHLAHAFQMQVSTYDPFVDEAALQEHGVKPNASLEALFAESDVVSLHCPLTRETRRLVDADMIRKMRRDAILVNTARGGLVDEFALVEALREGRIGGAGLDTFEQEPPADDNPLWQLPNVVVTPHIGGVTAAAMAQVSLDAARGIVETLAGRTLDSRRIVNAASIQEPAPSGSR